MKNVIIKMIMVCLVALIVCGGAVAFAAPEAAETLEQKYTVKSEDEIPKTITKDGYEYKLDRYTLTAVGEPQPVVESKLYSTTETKTNLEAAAADFDSYVNVRTEDGFSGRLARIKNEAGLDEEHSVITRRDQITVEIDHGYLHEKPYVEPYWEEDYVDEATQYEVHVRLPLVETEERGEKWQNARYYKFEFEGDKDGRYFIPLSQEILQLDAAAPDPKTYEEDILWLMGLEQSYYSLKSVKWDNELQATENKAGNEVTRRTAVFEIAEKETQYISVYSAEYPIPDIPRYFVTATYEGYVSKTTTESLADYMANYTGDYEAVAVYNLVEQEAIAQLEEQQVPLAGNLPVMEVEDYTIPLAGGIAAGGAIVAFLLWWSSKNCIIQSVNDGKRRTIKRLHLRNPEIIDITPYTNEGEPVVIMLHKKLLDNAEHNIIIANHGMQYVANHDVQNGKFAETYINQYGSVGA